MFLSLRTVTIVIFTLYFTLTCYTGYILFRSSSINYKDSDFTARKWSLPDDGEDWNPWGEEFEREKRHIYKSQSSVKWWTNQSIDVGKQYFKTKGSPNQLYQSYNVEIWGKAAIGLYLWEHILNGKLESKMDGIWSFGFKKIENFKLKFRTGPGVITSKAPTDVKHLVLVLNGRSKEKISFAKMWLDYLPNFQSIKTVILILLGDEKCENDWLIPYTSKAGGFVNTTFIVYDSPLVDNSHFYQWPLGVATYRGFPKIDPRKMDDLTNIRPYICNFLGSVYHPSSRETLLNVIQQYNLTQHCFIKARNEWKPNETKSSLNQYVQSLRLSDLTLNPVGMNTECYRIYEAMSLGSVPVVEDVMTPGKCGGSQIMPVPPLRLLKSLNAPLIYIKNWSELPDLISKELNMPLIEKINRRINLIRWYENFKFHFREQLLNVLKDNILR